jgi:hypothetical protein
MTFKLLDFADSVTEEIDIILKPLHSNKTLFTFVTLFLVLYGSLAKPKLPPILRQLFDNAIFRVGILSLILIKKGSNVNFSLMLAIAYIYTMQMNNMEKTKEKFQSKINFYYKN